MVTTGIDDSFLEDTIRLGRGYLDGGNLSAAKGKAEEALRHAPNSDSAWKFMHECIADEGNYQASLAFSEAWMQALPESRLAYRAVILDTLLGRKSGEGARALIDGYRDRYPDDLTKNRLDNLLYEMIFGNKKKAIEMSDDLFRDVPDMADILILRGWVSYEGDCCRDAYEMAKKAAAINPDNAEVHRLLAISAFREMRFREAHQAAAHGLTIEPDLRALRSVKYVALWGYFPLCWLGSLIILVGLRASCALKLPGILLQVSHIATTALLTYFVALPIIEHIASYLSRDGSIFPFLSMMALFLGWVILPEVLFTSSDAQPKMKTKSVTLDDY